MIDKFPCTGCGACCRRVGIIRKELATSGIQVREDGSCEHLTAQNQCAIYETRPSVCRVGNAKPPEMPMWEYWELTARICNIWQRQDGLPVQLRVDEDLIRSLRHAQRVEQDQGEERNSA
jgi:Fe-S-cluster containining protein